MNNPLYRHSRAAMLKWIAAFIEANGYPPTIREISQGCEIPSTDTVSFHLRRLEEERRIKRTPGIARSIVIMAQ